MPTASFQKLFKNSFGYVGDGFQEGTAFYQSMKPIIIIYGILFVQCGLFWLVQWMQSHCITHTPVFAPRALSQKLLQNGFKQTSSNQSLYSVIFCRRLKKTLIFQFYIQRFRINVNPTVTQICSKDFCKNPRKLVLSTI